MSPGGYVVAEVAGFQLETCTSFRPHVAAGLNITEDHLDRYGTMDIYASMKNRVFAWQTAADHAIANGEDARVVAGARASRAALLGVLVGARGRGRRVPDRGREEIVLRAAERRGALSVRRSGDRGHAQPRERHGVVSLGTPGGGPARGRPGRRARLSARSPHRMELVGARTDDDVRYYDDSKGTNVGAVAAALDGFPRPVVLIAGGKDKGGSYTPMIRALEKCARAVVLIGEATPIIEAALVEAGVAFPVVRAPDMHHAVRAARDLAQRGDAVVLSPACSSYDMFKNFEHRGKVFRNAVAALGAPRPVKTAMATGDAAVGMSWAPATLPARSLLLRGRPVGRGDSRSPRTRSRISASSSSGRSSFCAGGATRSTRSLARRSSFSASAARCFHAILTLVGQWLDLMSMYLLAHLLDRS